MIHKRSLTILVALIIAALSVSAARLATVRMGRQPDGGFLVSTGQRVEGGSLAFSGRPIDLALHPRDAVFAVLNKTNVFLATAEGIRRRTSVPLAASAGFRGLAWS